jgi:hypothetical protein
MAKTLTPALQHPSVIAVFDIYPPALRSKLLALRQLIFATAAETDGVGPLQETLKWGEPAYVTTTKSGSTVRIHCKKDQTRYAIYFNCNTTLVDTFRSLFPTTFSFEGNRAIVFNTADELPKKELVFCIAMALTYHLKNPYESRLNQKNYLRVRCQDRTKRH